MSFKNFPKYFSVFYYKTVLYLRICSYSLPNCTASQGTTDEKNGQKTRKGLKPERLSGLIVPAWGSLHCSSRFHSFIRSSSVRFIPDEERITFKSKYLFLSDLYTSESLSASCIQSCTLENSSMFLCITSVSAMYSPIFPASSTCYNILILSNDAKSVNPDIEFTIH